MKKILYVTTVSRTLNAFLIPHIRSLSMQGIKVDMASNRDLKLDKALKKNKFYKVNFSRNPIHPNNIKARKEIQNIVRKNKYDVVHVHTPVAAFVTRLALKDFKNVEVIYTAHGFHFYKGARLLNWALYYPLERIAAKWTDKIITINREDFEIAKSKFKNERCKVYKINGIGVDLKEYSNKVINLKFKKSLGLKDDDFVITVVAEFIKRKNHKQLINAIEKIKNEKIKVLFVGDGKLMDNTELDIQKRGLQDRIKLLGFRKDVEKIISVSDVIGLFSYQEGLPRIIMEGMAQSKPILCTSIRGNKDLVKDSYNGFLVKVDDVESTVKKIETLYSDKNLKKELGKNGSMAVERYKISNVLNQMSKIYGNKKVIKEEYKEDERLA